MARAQRVDRSLLAWLAGGLAPNLKTKVSIGGPVGARVCHKGPRSGKAKGPEAKKSFHLLLDQKVEPKVNHPGSWAGAG